MAKEKTETSVADATPATTGRVPFPLWYAPVSGAGVSLSYRAPSGRDMRRSMEKSGVDRYTELLVNLFEEPEATFERLDGRDYMRLVKLADSFFDPSLPTSTT